MGTFQNRKVGESMSILLSQIISNGGTIGSGVSKTTTILLAKSPNDSGGKLDKARALKIPIMNSIAFKKQYRL